MKSKQDTEMRQTMNNIDIILQMELSVVRALIDIWGELNE